MTGRKNKQRNSGPARGGSHSNPSRRHRRSARPPAAHEDPKVGSDASAAAQVGGKADFGVPESGAERDRAYVSRETKISDPGGMPERSGDTSTGARDTGSRVSGVGGRASGVGSSSGGDVDTDIVGVASAPVAQSGPDDRTDGPDMVRGDQRPSDAFAAKAPGDRAVVKGSNSLRTRPRKSKGTTIDRSGGDVSTTGSGQGPAAVTNPEARNDDSFAGEVNIDEASGIDNSPADRG